MRRCGAETMSEVRISKNPADLFRAAALEFSKCASEAVRTRDRFTVALSGGSTPKGLYSLLATKEIPVPWDDSYFFWGDERHVPPGDPESNYRMANEVMLSKIPVRSSNVFRIPTEEKDARTAARKYEDTLIRFFDLKLGDFPKFDLVLLGLGPDGHTASLFPDSPALEEKQRLVVANPVEKFYTDRLTLTLPVLNRARTIVFLVSGQEKAGILQQVLDGPDGKFPSQLIQPDDGELLWLVDEAAASQLAGSK